MTRLLFISTKNRWFHRLTQIALVVALILVMLSAYTRANGTAQACPDWPWCFGSPLAPLTLAQQANAAAQFPHTIMNNSKIWLTLSERYLIFIEGALLLALTGTAVMIKRQIDGRALIICLILLGLAGSQIVCNKLAITQKYAAFSMIGSLLTGLGILSLLWWTAAITRPNSYTFSHPSLKRLRPWAWLALWLIILQVTFGGWLNYAATNPTCKNFPYCNVQLTPPIDWQKALHASPKNAEPETAAYLHSLHRVGAIMAFAYLALFSFLLMFNRYIYHLAIVLFALLSAQFCFGMCNLSWLSANLAFVGEHTLIAALLLALVSLLINLYDKPQDYWYG